MNIFDYTTQGRRPSTRQIISDWRKAGRPGRFQVEYGETFAEFEQVTSYYALGVTHVLWYDSGNGCRGVDRLAVVRALEAAEGER